jgi:hypothetical protein
MGGKDGAEKIAAALQVHVIPQNSETLQTRAFRAQRLTFQVAAGAQLLTNGVLGE